jgi:O-antigen/teichoic acid export membrane protein
VREEPTAASRIAPLGGEGLADLRALARSSTLSLVGMIAKGILGFALVFVVTRGLGAGGAGLFFQAVALFTILSAVEMGADTGLVRFVSRFRTLGRDKDLRRTIAIAVYPVAAITTVLAVAVFAAAPALARLLFQRSDFDQAVTAIRILSFFLPIAAVSDVLVGGTRGFETVVPYVAVESFGKPLLRPILLLTALATGSAVVGTLTAWAIPLPLGLLAAAIWVGVLLRRADEQNDARLSAATPYRQLAGEFWRFCVPQGISTFLQTAVRSLDILLVGAMRTAAEAGVYAAVSRTVLYGLFAIDALRIAIAPQISALLAGDDRSRAESVYRVATWWLILVSWPIYLMLGVFAPVVMSAFGPGFSSGQHALLILSLAMLMGTGTGNVSTVLLMGGKSGSVLFNTAAALVVDVLLDLLLIPRHGIEGAAIAWLLSIAVGELLALWQVWRHLRIDPLGWGFAVASLGSVMCYGGVGLLVRWSLGPSVSSAILALVISTGAYAVLLFRFRSMLQLAALWHVFSARFRRRAASRAHDGENAR